MQGAAARRGPRPGSRVGHPVRRVGGLSPTSSAGSSVVLATPATRDGPRPGACPPADAALTECPSIATAVARSASCLPRDPGAPAPHTIASSAAPRRGPREPDHGTAHEVLRRGSPAVLGGHRRGGLPRSRRPPRGLVAPHLLPLPSRLQRRAARLPGGRRGSRGQARAGSGRGGRPGCLSGPPPRAPGARQAVPRTLGPPGAAPRPRGGVGRAEPADAGSCPRPGPAR